MYIYIFICIYIYIILYTHHTHTLLVQKNIRKIHNFTIVPSVARRCFLTRLAPNSRGFLWGRELIGTLHDSESPGKVALSKAFGISGHPKINPVVGLLYAMLCTGKTPVFCCSMLLVLVESLLVLVDLGKMCSRLDNESLQTWTNVGFMVQRVQRERQLEEGMTLRNACCSVSAVCWLKLRCRYCNFKEKLHH